MQPGLFIVALVLVSALIWFQPWRRRVRHLDAGHASFPVPWLAGLQGLPLYEHLPSELQDLLQQRILLFLSGRRFIGCRGLAVSDEMRVLIAAQACVLALGRNPDPWPELDTILVYPDVFLSPHRVEHEGGVVEEDLRELEGESWSGRQVVLAWSEVRAGALDPHDGVNVVIHEFAHQLDTLDGGTGGLPHLPADVSLAEWSREWAAAFERLQADVDAHGEEAWLDPAATENAGEFLAYVIEVFIECPWLLEEEEPALYGLLTRVLGIDPIGWECPSEQEAA